VAVFEDVEEAVGVGAGAVVESESEAPTDFAVDVVGVFVGEGVEAEHGFGIFVTELPF